MSPDELEEAGNRLNEMAAREVPRSIRGQVVAQTSVSEQVDWLGSYRQAGCIQAAVDRKSSTFGEFMEAAKRLAEAARQLRS